MAVHCACLRSRCGHRPSSGAPVQIQRRTSHTVNMGTATHRTRRAHSYTRTAAVHTRPRRQKGCGTQQLDGPHPQPHATTTSSSRTTTNTTTSTRRSLCHSHFLAISSARQSAHSHVRPPVSPLARLHSHCRFGYLVACSRHASACDVLAVSPQSSIASLSDCASRVRFERGRND